MSGFSTSKEIVTSSSAAIDQAIAFHREGRLSEAQTLLYAAILRDPGNPKLYNARGVILAALGSHVDAVTCYREGVALDPAYPTIWSNLGNALTDLKLLQSAIYCHRRAISLSRGEDASFHYNLGISFAEASQHGDAVLAFDRALEIEPAKHQARLNRALSYLHLGNYRRGFVDFEARKATGELSPKKLPGKAWDGSAYANKRLVLVAEQGFGDMIWASRYLSRVKAMGGELVIECPSDLIPLLETLGAADRFVVRGAPLPAADYHCYFCSLPGLFTTDYASIPREPFIAAPSDRLRRFDEMMKRGSSNLRVGIVWSGSVTFKRNHERAQSLLKFSLGFAMPGVQLFSLQKGPPELELQASPKEEPIVDLSPYIRDFADTAAALSHLDLIIMTDSAVAHLAASMGKSVWLLLGHVAHWMWLHDRTDSPWYPSMRLFRPRGEGDWDHVFDSASAALMELTMSMRLDKDNNKSGQILE
jgi:tetratricopeptide (TPR) repeat protein